MTERHRLQIHCPNGSPSEATIRLDGEQLLFVSRFELVLDSATREATVRLTIPAEMLDLDVDAAAFITAYGETVSTAKADSGDALTATCTASILAATAGQERLYRCTKTVGHYDGDEIPNAHAEPPVTGGWHVDGDFVWSDRADGAFPHAGAPQPAAGRE